MKNLINKIQFHFSKTSKNARAFFVFVFLFFFLVNAAHAQSAIDEIIEIGNATSTNQQYSARGIFNCEGAGYAPVGLQGPSQIFVPVFDEATFSHVQLLSYKECVLDKVAAHAANAIKAGIVGTYLKLVNDQNLIIEDLDEYLQKKEMDELIKFNEKCKARAKSTSELNMCRYIVKKYYEKYKDPYRELDCPVPEEDLQRFRDGKYVNPEVWATIVNNPACTSFGRVLLVEKLAMRDLANRVAKEEKLVQNGSIAPVKEKKKVQKFAGTDENGAPIFKEEEKELVVTPAPIVAGQLNLVLGSGLRSVENVDEIDEMVQSFLANLHNRAIDASRGGVSTIAEAIDATQSYVDLMIEQEREVAQQFRAYTGVGSLNGMIQNEEEYLKYKEELLGYILKAIHDFRSYENACFVEKIIPGAKEDLAQAAEEEACASYAPPVPEHAPGPPGSQTSTSTCPYTATVEEEILKNYLDISEKQDGNVVEHGTFVFTGSSDSQSSATLLIMNDESKATSTTVSLDDSWTLTLDSKSIPDGELTASLSDPSYGLVSNTFYKTTIASVPAIELPLNRYKIKITAKSGLGNSIVKSAILQISRKYSNEQTDRNSQLFNLLTQTLQEIEDTRKVLAILYQIAQEANDNPELATWKVDQLVSKNLIHTAADVRAAQDQATAASGQLSSFVQDTVQNEWEADGAGWCNKDKWQEFEVSN